MVPGYLHFDASSGLTAPLLNAAMADLLRDQQCLREALRVLDLEAIEVAIAEEQSYVRGASVRFSYEGQAFEMIDAALCPIKNPFLKACLASESVDLSFLFEPFTNSRLDPRISALAFKILEHLKSPRLVEPKLKGADGLLLFCHTLMLAAQLRALDPKLVTASPLHWGIAGRGTVSCGSILRLDDPLWISDTLRGLPFSEVEGEVALDALALAFIKSVSGLFGPRGACRVLQLGIGFAKHGAAKALLEASWCEASIPDTISELGPSNKAKYFPLLEVSGLVPAGFDMPSVVSMLSLHKAMTITFHMVHGEKNVDFHLVRFLIKYEHKKDALEAFLLKAAASNVTLSAVESHELNKRMVLVPLGHGNKSSSARFFEYIYYDKCVRVEPWKEDLEAYVKKTDYSVEVARADLLMAWKKWRGRAVEDSHD